MKDITWAIIIFGGAAIIISLMYVVTTNYMDNLNKSIDSMNCKELRSYLGKELRSYLAAYNQDLYQYALNRYLIIDECLGSYKK